MQAPFDMRFILTGARTPQDRDCYGRRIQPQEAGPHPLRLRRVSPKSTMTI